MRSSGAMVHFDPHRDKRLQARRDDVAGMDVVAVVADVADPNVIFSPHTRARRDIPKDCRICHNRHRELGVRRHQVVLCSREVASS
jgi:hypothetical protein